VLPCLPRPRSIVRVVVVIVGGGGEVVVLDAHSYPMDRERRCVGGAVEHGL
jgi:hypothetical protein